MWPNMTEKKIPSHKPVHSTGPIHWYYYTIYIWYMCFLTKFQCEVERPFCFHTPLAKLSWLSSLRSWSSVSLTPLVIKRNGECGRLTSDWYVRCSACEPSLPRRVDGIGASWLMRYRQANSELATTYAALILADDGIEITVSPRHPC